MKAFLTTHPIAKIVENLNGPIKMFNEEKILNIAKKTTNPDQKLKIAYLSLNLPEISFQSLLSSYSLLFDLCDENDLTKLRYLYEKTTHFIKKYNKANLPLDLSKIYDKYISTLNMYNLNYISYQISLQSKNQNSQKYEIEYKKYINRIKTFFEKDMKEQREIELKRIKTENELHEVKTAQLYSEGDKILNLKDSLKLSEDNTEYDKPLTLIKAWKFKLEKIKKEDERKGKFQKKFAVYKEWYDKAREFLQSRTESPDFPRECDNMQLVSYKQMWLLQKENETMQKFLLNIHMDKISFKDYVLIGENEWRYYNSAFLGIYEIEIESESILQKKYYPIKVLILNPKLKQLSIRNIKWKYILVEENATFVDIKRKIDMIIKQKIKSLFFGQFECNAYEISKNINCKKDENIEKWKIKKKFKFELLASFLNNEQTSFTTSSKYLDKIVGQEKQPFNILFKDKKYIPEIIFDCYLKGKEQQFINLISPNKCIKCESQFENRIFYCNKCLHSDSVYQYCSNEHKDTDISHHQYHNAIKEYIDTNFLFISLLFEAQSIQRNDEHDFIPLTPSVNKSSFNAALRALLHCHYLTHCLNNIEDYNADVDYSNKNKEMNFVIQYIDFLKKIMKRKDNTPIDCGNVEKAFNEVCPNKDKMFIDIIKTISIALNRAASIKFEAKSIENNGLSEWDKEFNKENSIVKDLFYGQSKRELNCNDRKCGNSEIKYDVFFPLNLPIPLEKNSSFLYCKMFKPFATKAEKDLIRFEIKNCSNRKVTVRELYSLIPNKTFKAVRFGIKNNEFTILRGTDTINERGRIFSLKNGGELILYESITPNGGQISFFVFPLRLTREVTGKCIIPFLCAPEEKIISEKILDYPMHFSFSSNQTLNELITEVQQRFKEYDGEEEEIGFFESFFIKDKINRLTIKEDKGSKHDFIPLNDRYKLDKKLYEVFTDNLNNEKSVLLFYIANEALIQFENKKFKTEENKVTLSSITLEDCFDLYKNSKEKTLCDKCGNNMKVNNLITRPPVYLTLYLDRFKDKKQKFESLIEYKEKIRLGEIIDKDIGINGINYELESVIEHKGSDFEGKYSTIIKRKGEWYEEGDDKEKTRDNKHLSKHALILIYKIDENLK